MNNTLSSGSFFLNIVIIFIISLLAIFLLKFSYYVVLIEITQLSHRNFKLFKIPASSVLCGFEIFFFKDLNLKKCFAHLLLSYVFLGCLNHGRNLLHFTIERIQWRHFEPQGKGIQAETQRGEEVTITFRDK